MSLSSRPIAAAFGVGALLLTGCTRSGGGSTPVESRAGTLAEKPGGGIYIVDQNAGGKATRLELVDIEWGRLVDVYDLDETGEIRSEPVLVDFLINENTQTLSGSYVLETNAITQETRLVVRDNHETNPERFAALIENAAAGLPPIVALDEGNPGATYSFMARNASLVLRFSDVLSDSAADEAALESTVKLFTGYAPEDPFRARILFDRNHGDVINGKFHSTRVIVDMTVTESEAGEIAGSVPVNTLGLPASQIDKTEGNVSIRIPTVTDPIHGQFKLLRGLSGAALSQTNLPVDTSSTTKDVVRSFRAGNSRDNNNGFMLDLNPPEIVGSWSVALSRPRFDPLGQQGFDFLVDVTFTTACRAGLDEGDVLSVGDLFLEVTQLTSDPDGNGLVADVKTRALVRDALTSTNGLFGSGFMLSTYEPTSSVNRACWISFAPQPEVVPNAQVFTESQAVVRFSEPMNPASVTPFDTFMIVRGPASVASIEAEKVVVGKIVPSGDLRQFAFTPLLPLSHVTGFRELFNVRLNGVTDLSGNALRNPLPAVGFTVREEDPDQLNASVALRFSDLDEVKPVDPTPDGGMDDVRGQVFYDLARGVLKPRGVTFTQYPADRGNPVPAIMIPFPPGVQTPLSPLGSRTMYLWRYCDLGWIVTDETKYNLDVYGLNWAPIGGLVVRDFYDRFEISLSHSKYLPDEAIDGNLLPEYRLSGLLRGPSLFTENLLVDSISPQTVVHDRSLGYTVDPTDIFVASSGTKMIPYPLNRAGGTKLSTWTWRDTAFLGQGGPNSAGVPTDIETGDPLNIVPGGPGTRYKTNSVRSIGLPLLMEFKCFPSDTGIGLNPLDISLAINSSVWPNFRCFSTGGVNQNGNLVKVAPDFELAPQGGFNPSSRPPGQRTQFSADNSFYIGQLDAVIRVSRAHTVWIDTGYNAADFLAPVVIPDPNDQPPGTSVVVDFHGATGFAFAATNGDKPKAFDAAAIGPYGYILDFGASTPRELNVSYVPDAADDSWFDDITKINGARYLQMRFSFLNNIDSRLSPELSAVGIAFTEQQL